MTVKVVVCIRDIKADTFYPPVFEASEGTAIRSFSQAVNGGGDNLLAQYPDDFELVKLGTWNDETAQFECGLPVQLAHGAFVRITK